MTLIDEVFEEAVLAAAVELHLAAHEKDRFALLLAEAKRLELRTQAAVARAQSRMTSAYATALESISQDSSPLIVAKSLARAEALTREALEGAWIAGSTASRSSVLTNLRHLNIIASIPEATAASAYLTSVLENLSLVTEQTAVSILTGEAPMEAIRRALWRANMGASVVPVRAASQLQLEAMTAAQQQNPKLTFTTVWVTSLLPTTCATCAALHGQIVDVGDEFSHEITFALDPKVVYSGLPGPPRHPNCHCRLIPYIIERLTKSALTPTALRSQGIEFAMRAAGMAPRSFQTQDFSTTAKTTNFMTSDDVKKIPEGKWQMIKDGFKACVIGLKRR